MISLGSTSESPPISTTLKKSENGNSQWALFVQVTDIFDAYTGRPNRDLPLSCSYETTASTLQRRRVTGVSGVCRPAYG